MQPYYIGVDIGGTKVAYGLYNEKKELLGRWQHLSDSAAGAAVFLDEVAAQIRSAMGSHNIPAKSLAGVGVCVPSFVLFEEGVILKTPNLPKLCNFPARAYLEVQLETRVVLDNDCNVAALAESRYGAGSGFRHILYCAVSTGLGSGIIIDGKVFRGSYGFAGEAGHMLVDVQQGDLECECGHKGCFESHIGGSKITKRVARRIQLGEKSVIEELCGGKLEAITAQDIHKACEMGDGLALWALEHMARYLGLWLYNLYQIFNMDCFVFGGGITHFGPILFNRVRAVFDCLNQNELPVYFKMAGLGDDFGIRGAVELLFEKV